MEIRLINAALDDDGNGDLILRGTLDLETLSSIQVDKNYQRKPFPLTGKQLPLLKKMKAGERVPDIILSARGQNFCEKEPGMFVVKDPTFVVDGLQRATAAKHVLERISPAPMRMGAVVYFGKTRDWEREKFKELNTTSRAISPNVLLRNEREDNHAVLTLYGLSTRDSDFALYKRVTWEQAALRGELITGMQLAKAVGYLHAHLGPGKSTNYGALAIGLSKIADTIGLNTLRENTRTFFDVMDECWGIRSIEYKDFAVHLKGGFLWALAKVFSEHRDFWKEDKHLVVEAHLRKKLALFPMHDPSVVQQASIGGKAKDMLYATLVSHINSGKRNRRLQPR
ncbi:MAG: hypothetical protein ACXV2A_06970 [Halobacteriota archaeon]